MVDDVSGEVVEPDLRPGSCKEADTKCQVLFTRHPNFGKGLKSKCYGNLMKHPGGKTEFLIRNVKNFFFVNPLNINLFFIFIDYMHRNIIVKYSDKL